MKLGAYATKNCRNLEGGMKVVGTITSARPATIQAMRRFSKILKEPL
jgi:hypothetical protein